MCVQNYKIIIHGGNPSMDNRVLAVKNEVKRAIIGKDDAIDKVMSKNQEDELFNTEAGVMFG